MQESQHTEFKQLWKDDWLKTLCAFANSEGGSLFLGVSDDGGIVGVPNTKSLLETLPNKINHRLGILADVILHSQDGVNYLEIRIPRTYAPVSYGGRFYQRSGSNTIELNGGSLTHFLLKKYGKTWEDVAVEEFTLDEIDPDTVAKFKRLAKDRVPEIDKEIDLAQLLRKLNLYDGPFLKRAAVLSP